MLSVRCPGFASNAAGHSSIPVVASAPRKMCFGCPSLRSESSLCGSDVGLAERPVALVLLRVQKIENVGVA